MADFSRIGDPRSMTPRANCRKSNLDVYISNDLMQACANDAPKHPNGAIEIGCGRMVDSSSTSQTNGSTRTRSIADPSHWHDLRAEPPSITPYFSIFPGLQAK